MAIFHLTDMTQTRSGEDAQKHGGQTPSRRNRRFRGCAGLLAAGLLTVTSACGLEPSSTYVPESAPGSIEPIPDLPEGTQLTVTTKNFTEQLILGKIGVLTAQAAGFDVVDQTNIPGPQALRQLMTDHTADMTYEYTGTAWLTYLGHDEGIPDPDEQWEAVRDADASLGLTWLPPAPLNNVYALAMSSETKDKLGDVSNLSDIADLPPEELTFCIESDFNSRSDGFQPMLEHYGIDVPDGNVKILDAGAVYTATEQGDCNFGEVFTTDGRIKSLNLTVLEDDQSFFPAYNASPVINTELLEKYPELEDAYNQVSEKLTNDVLIELNRQVDVDGREPADVAFDWMVDEGFITEP